MTLCCVWTFAERVKERAERMKFDLIFLAVALPFNFFVFWTNPLTALAVFVTMLFLRYVSPVGE